MATPRKKPASRSKVQTVDTNEYNRLEIYCIWLNEYYNALLTAGFKHEVALSLVMDKDSYPNWVEFRIPTDNEISKYMDEDED